MVLARRHSAHDPPMIGGADTTIGQISGRWWLLHTMARNEKALACDLQAMQVAFFLPLVQITRRYGHRRFDLRIPLFPGYLFCACASDSQRYQVLSTQRVANLVSVEDQERLKAELEQILRALHEPNKIDLFAGLRTGRRCRVTAGSLKGLEGVVITRKGMSRLFLDVSILGQSAVVEIDPMHVEPID